MGRRRLHPHFSSRAVQDIEAAEFFTIPRLISSGAICEAVDYISVEFHSWFLRNGPIDLHEHGVYLSTMEEADARVREMQRAVNQSAPACRTHEISVLDDETYNRDLTPEQLHNPRPMATR